MAWNNFEIIGDEETLNISYDGLCDEIKRNIKVIGTNRTIEQYMREEFENAGNIESIKKQKNLSLFLQECDETYMIIFEELRALIDCIIPLTSEKRTFYSCLNRDCKTISQMIEMNIADIELIKKRNPNIEGLDLLKNLRNGKSVMKVFIDDIDKIIQLYCERTGKNLPKMRRNIYYTLWQAYMMAFKLDRVLETKGFGDTLLLQLDVMNKSKMERVERPFSYYLDSLD